MHTDQPDWTSQTITRPLGLQQQSHIRQPSNLTQPREQWSKMEVVVRGYVLKYCLHYEIIINREQLVFVLNPRKNPYNNNYEDFFLKKKLIITTEINTHNALNWNKYTKRNWYLYMGITFNIIILLIIVSFIRGWRSREHQPTVLLKTSKSNSWGSKLLCKCEKWSACKRHLSRIAARSFLINPLAHLNHRCLWWRYPCQRENNMPVFNSCI